ncbi:uncharacterized protein LOC143029735 [Oratosquilla oratoria]|uniref:uncharacterized protein LOC143029735 n=1 Tax=Oratosquilla oratoria TaxID=337810 RepID=UPI003F763959
MKPSETLTSFALRLADMVASYAVYHPEREDHAVFAVVTRLKRAMPAQFASTLTRVQESSIIGVLHAAIDYVHQYSLNVETVYAGGEDLRMALYPATGAASQPHPATGSHTLPRLAIRESQSRILFIRERLRRGGHRNTWKRNRARGTQNRWRPYCTYCRKVGHSTESCYFSPRGHTSTCCQTCGGAGRQEVRPKVTVEQETPVEIVHVDFSSPHGAGGGLAMVAVTLFEPNATQSVCALLDTGAAVSLIHKSILPVTTKGSQGGEIRIIVADGSELPNLGKVTVRFGLAGFQFEHSFFIIPAEGLPAKLILGIDFLAAHKVTLTFRPLTFKVEGKDIPVIFAGTANHTSPMLTLCEETQSHQGVSEAATFQGKTIEAHWVPGFSGGTLGPVLERADKLAPAGQAVSALFTPRTYAEGVSLLGQEVVELFRTDDGDPLTVTPHFFHEIRTIGPPVYRKSYPIPEQYREDIREQIGDMLRKGIIRPSRSPYNAPVVPVVKKDKSIRLCLDFRALNHHVVDDRFPLPHIDSMLRSLGTSVIFSLLDLKQGYLQIPLVESSCEKTAFSTPEGHYEFTSLPFGLKDAPSCFQRVMNQVLTGLLGVSAMVYMDDIIVLGTSWDDHLKNLEDVLQRLQEASLSLRLEKCHFFQKEVAYLGHVISQEGIKPQPEKVRAIKTFPQPARQKELLSFLGLAGYYRKFIPNFAEISLPLVDMTKGDVARKHKDREFGPWTPAQVHAFESLKSHLSSTVVLPYPNFAKPFLLTTDASASAIGGVLQQEDEGGRRRPLSYFSRTLNEHERRYSAIEREVLTVV